MEGSLAHRNEREPWKKGIGYERYWKYGDNHGNGFGDDAFLLLIALGLYLFYCFCSKRICEKCGVNPGVLIWIPIVQLVPLLQVAKMPVWMIILFLIPLVSLIVCVFMWIKICIARGKSGWLVILFFIPVLNLIFIPYLAFSE